MKHLLFLLLFSILSYDGFAQTSEVAVGDTAAPTRGTRTAFKVAANNQPFLVRKGWTPRRIALYSDLSGYGDGLYVSLTGSYNNPNWLTGVAYSKVTGFPTTNASLGLTDVDTYQTVATYSAMNALSYSANTAKRVLVTADEIYGKANQWYMVWADSGGSMHSDKIVTITEK